MSKKNNKYGHDLGGKRLDTTEEKKVQTTSSNVPSFALPNCQLAYQES